MRFWDLLCLERCRACGDDVRGELRDAETLCTDCWMEITDSSPVIEPLSLPHYNRDMLVVSAVPYKGAAKKLIYSLKYDDDRLIALDLAQLLAACLPLLPPEVSEQARLVPVPLHWFRLLKRGFNQAEVLAEHLSREIRLPVDRRLLTRRRATRAHHNLGKQERASNIAGAFQANPRSSGCNLILIDDIYTSGATLAESAEILLQAGAASVCGITVARAQFAD